MTLLLTLIEYCVSKGVLLGDGVDAFRDFTPEAPDRVAVFREYSGDPITPFSSHVHRSVQVLTRSQSAEDARSLAVSIVGVLRPSAEDMRVDFDETRWGQVYIRQLPFKLSQDESDRVTYCFNLGITTNIIE
jgi:hypothetical protein